MGLCYFLGFISLQHIWLHVFCHSNHAKKNSLNSRPRRTLPQWVGLHADEDEGPCQNPVREKFDCGAGWRLTTFVPVLPLQDRTSQCPEGDGWETITTTFFSGSLTSSANLRLQLSHFCKSKQKVYLALSSLPLLLFSLSHTHTSLCLMSTNSHINIALCAFHFGFNEGLHSYSHNLPQNLHSSSITRKKEDVCFWYAALTLVSLSHCDAHNQECNLLSRDSQRCHGRGKQQWRGAPGLRLRA